MIMVCRQIVTVYTSQAAGPNDDILKHCFVQAKVQKPKI